MQFQILHLPPPQERPAGTPELRWIADAYEQAQQVRIQTGERLRALVQGREAGWQVDASDWPEPEKLLQAVRRGETDGPAPLLGRTYRRHWEAEREYAAAMAEALRGHPSWPWLSQVKGIGATLAAKLLARLDVGRAATPSAFWAYCGLATVPGVAYRCADCGFATSFPPGHRVTGVHVRLGSKTHCEGRLEAVDGAGGGVRIAQPRPVRGERAAYDMYAKKVCYLIGTSFLKAGGAYADYYRREKAKLAQERPGWTASRRHLAALRKAEKLFLAHLWLVWREAVGLPLTQPYAGAIAGREVIDPWAMIGRARPEAPQPVGTSMASMVINRARPGLHGSVPEAGSSRLRAGGGQRRWRP